MRMMMLVVALLVLCASSAWALDPMALSLESQAAPMVAPTQPSAMLPPMSLEGAGAYSISGAFQGAGLAYIYPFSDASSEVDADVAFKLLPIPEPAEVKDILTGLQKIAATVDGDLLFPIDDLSSMNIGASAPIYSAVSGAVSGGLGLAYVRGKGVGALVKGTVGAPTTAQTLVALAPGQTRLAWSMSPKGAFLTWSKAL